jgi:hypothetical protein
MLESFKNYENIFEWINICHGSGKMIKILILSKNLIRKPHVKVLQKPQKYVFVDRFQK